MYVNGRLFKHADQLGDDVYALSESIDSLVEARVSLENFLGAVASSLGRVVEGHVFGRRLRNLPNGTPGHIRMDPGQLALTTAGVDVHIDPPLPEPASRFIRQRLVHAMRLIAHYDESAQVAEGVGDQVGRLLSAVGSEESRVRVCRRLGLGEARFLTVAAVAGAGKHPKRAERLAVDLAGGNSVLTAHVGGVLGIILRRPPNLAVGVPEGLSVGLGEQVPPERLHQSWKGAKTALRFSLPSRHSRGPYREFDAVIVDIRRVGAMRVLAEAVDQADAQQLADVKAIRALADTGLPDALSVLEAVAATDSIRQAAQLVHLHHNTVAQRVGTAEELLGFSFRERYGRARLLVGLTLHRLSSSRGIPVPGAGVGSLQAATMRTP